MQRRPTSYLILLTLMWGALSFHWTVIGNNIVPTRVLEFSTAATKGTMLGIVTVAGALVAMFTAPIAGILSDEATWRWGRRGPFLLVGTILNAVALLWLIGSVTFAGFVCANLAVQFFANIGQTPYTAMIPDQVPDVQKGAATGIAGFSEVIGRLSGAILGGLLVSLPVTAMALAPFLFFLPAHVARHPMMPLTGLMIILIVGAMILTLRYVHEPPASSHPRMTSTASFLRRAFTFDVRAAPSFAWLLAARAMNMLAINSITTFLLYYVHDYLGVAAIEEANAKVGYLFAVSAVTTLPSALAIGYLIDRSQRRKVWVYVSSFGLALVCMAFIAISRFSGALAVGAVFGVCYGIYFTSDWSLALALLPKDGTAAKYMGIWNIAGTFPQVIAPGIGGLLLDRFNALSPNLGYPALFVTVVVYLFLGTAMLWKVVEPAPVIEIDLGPRRAVQGG